MKREHILSLLYDLTLTIGGEVRLDALLTKVLQRLLFHTAFPAGVMLMTGGEAGSEAPGSATPGSEAPGRESPGRESPGSATPGSATPGQASSGRVILTASVGDHGLAASVGQPIDVPPSWLDGDSALIDDVGQAPWLRAGSRAYRHVLKLPVSPEGVILLLSPETPTSALPLTQVFRPVLRNLAKAIQLCRHSEQLTRRLISDRDQARSDLAAALQRSERERVFLRQLTDTFPDLVWLKDPEGVYLACNPPFERLYGAREADIVGRTDEDFVPKAMAQAFRANDLAALASEAPHVNEEWLTFASDGHRGLFETTKMPMRDTAGQVLGVLGIARDITQRRRDEEQLHLAASVFVHAREGIMITGADGTILQVNKAFTDITGYTRAEVVGRNPRMFRSGGRAPSSMPSSGGR